MAEREVAVSAYALTSGVPHRAAVVAGLAIVSALGFTGAALWVVPAMA